jgi:DNA polymerase-3 subunit gamma/tau
VESRPPPKPLEQATDAVETVAVKIHETAPDIPPPARFGATPPLPVVEPGSEGDFWHALVQDLIEREAITALTRELALQAQLLSRTAEGWRLRVESESLANSAARERLQTALAQIGQPVTLEIEVGPVKDSPARRNTIANTQRLKAAEALLLADPFVLEMMRDFGAKIVPGSIKPL